MFDETLFENIVEILGQAYTKRELEASFKSPAIKFILDKTELLRKKGYTSSLFDLCRQKTFNKTNLLAMAAVPFMSKSNFKAFKKQLSDEVQKVMDELIWTGKLHQNEIEEKLGIKIYFDRHHIYSPQYRRVYRELKNEFRLFKSINHNPWDSNRANFSLFLPEDFRKIISGYYDLPAKAEFHPIKDPDKTEHLYTSGEADIFMELPRIIAYASQGQIKLTTKGKPVASTLGKMQRKLNLKEFYPGTRQKALKNIRTASLAGLIVTMSKRQNLADTAALIKSELFLQNYLYKYDSAPNILTYLKGIGYIDSWHYHKVEGSFLGILRAMPAEEWISFENLEGFIHYNFLKVQVLPEYTANDKLYYQYQAEKSDDEYYHFYSDKHYITPAIFHKALVIPYIKGTFFLLAAFGLVDLAFDEPDTEIMGKTCQSPYDGLRYIRLSKLGPYVGGKNQDYEAPQSAAGQKIILTQDALMIITDKEDTTAPILLEPYTERVGPVRYRTDPVLFLKDCRTKKDLQDKINLFKQTVSSDLPPNWLQFFRELEQKVNPFEKAGEMKIFKISHDNKALIQLVARDALLKNLVVKAEGFHILVPKKNLPAFKKRLREFGYLVY